ncbi:MAG: lysylphosphatidylglycerol synthase transmembrane domain-containing protein [Polyangiales bacterium]
MIQEPATEAPRSLFQRYGLKTLLSLLIAGAFVWALARAGLPIVPSKATFASVRWGWVALHTGILILVHFLRAARWRHLLRPLVPDIDTRKIIAASWLGFTAILLLPLRAGEIVRPLLVRDGKRVTLSAALGTIGAERVIDGLVVTAVLAGALVFVPRLNPLPDHVGDLKIPVSAIPAAGYLTLVVFVGAFVAMAIFYFARSFAQKLVHATVGLISDKLADRVAAIVGGLADGLHFLGDRRHGMAFIGETLFYWSLNAVGMWVLGIACGLPMTFGHACAVMGVLAVGILVPAGPGLFGAFQAATYGALAMFFTPAMVTREGAAYVFLLYSVQFVWHLIAAGLAAAAQPSLLGRRA